ncbi:helix-turn-helix domain-containing protein [Planotetraspora sp. A-T 1434]|uniref:helix-turn-helix domain-containing protein n=1 Tax=Planotetraspora sp. A-T 1434 TaxID=2979219 RepID=UPI003965B134
MRRAEDLPESVKTYFGAGDSFGSGWPTTSVRQAARLLGITREAGYDAVHRGDLPSIRIGRKILIPTAKLAAMLGLPYPPPREDVEELVHHDD